MMNSIKWFKTRAKGLHKSFKKNDPEAMQRVKAALRSAEGVGLQRIQHVIAQEVGFGNWKALLDAPDIERQLVIVMSKEPLLSRLGLGMPQGGLPDSKQEAELQEERLALRGSAEKVAWIVDWLQEQVIPIKTINQNWSSYSIKHLVERHHPGEHVFNGELIAAAIIAGYPYAPGRYNPYFGMSERSLQRLSTARPTKRRPHHSIRKEPTDNFLEQLRAWSTEPITSVQIAQYLKRHRRECPAPTQVEWDYIQEHSNSRFWRNADARWERVCQWYPRLVKPELLRERIARYEGQARAGCLKEHPNLLKRWCAAVLEAWEEAERTAGGHVEAQLVAPASSPGGRRTSVVFTLGYLFNVPSELYFVRETRASSRSHEWAAMKQHPGAFGFVDLVVPSSRTDVEPAGHPFPPSFTSLNRWILGERVFAKAW